MGEIAPQIDDPPSNRFDIPSPPHTDPTGACKLRLLGRLVENPSSTLLRSSESMTMRAVHNCFESVGSLENGWYKDDRKGRGG
jgi:hypothetical protein